MSHRRPIPLAGGSIAGLLAAGSLILLPGAADAHTGVATASGFWAGAAHPLSGLDHVLAMSTVGMLAAAFGGRARLGLPLAFVVAMAAGGALGMAGMALPAVETMIALSVLVLGGVLAIGVALPAAGATALVGAFALFHGHAHGAEAPLAASGFAYGAGFLLSTLALQGAGLVLGRALPAPGRRWAVPVRRAVGGGVALAGAGLLLGLI